MHLTCAVGESCRIAKRRSGCLPKRPTAPLSCACRKRDGTRPESLPSLSVKIDYKGRRSCKLNNNIVYASKRKRPVLEFLNQNLDRVSYCQPEPESPSLPYSIMKVGVIELHVGGLKLGLI